MERMFEVLMELDENQVTMSPALVKHMMKHNLNRRRELVLMPIVDKADKGSDIELVGIDVNPPYDVVDAKYQSTLSTVQYDPKSKLTGFQMEDPTVIGLWTKYMMVGMRDLDHPESMKKRMHVMAKKKAGRWTYWFMPEALNMKEKESRKTKTMWTAWMIKLGVY